MAVGGIPGDVSAGTVVTVIGLALMVVDGLIFLYYAVRNALANPFEGQRAFWRYLVAVGGTAVVFGVAGFVELVVASRLASATGDLALLLLVATVAFAMREVYYNSSLAPPPERRRVALSTVRRIEVGLFAVIVLEWLAVVFVERVTITTTIKAGASVALTGYGTLFNERLDALTGGTSLDTLRLHLFPILAMTGLLGVVEVGRLLDVPAPLVNGVESALVVLVGGLLLPATIRLQQNVANR